MKKNTSRMTIIILGLVAILGISAYAFADWERGYGGRHMMEYDGQGYHRGPMHGYWNSYMGDDLKDEDIKKMNNARREFLKETEDLRADVNEKEILIRNELSRSEPDATKVLNLQKELSALRAVLDEKWVTHVIAMKKINPDIGRGYAMGYGPKQGRGYGGYCWR